MKKVVIAFSLLTVFILNAFAQNIDSKSEYKNLYTKTVTKLSPQKWDVIKTETHDTIVGFVQIMFEKHHFCLCHDKQCRGPRLTLTMDSKKVSVFIFPNGDCFAEVNRLDTDVLVVPIDTNNEMAEEMYFKEAAKKVLLTYSK